MPTLSRRTFFTGSAAAIAATAIRRVPVAAFLIAMGQGWVVTQPMLSRLIFTLAIFGLLALPGAVMIRQAPR